MTGNVIVTERAALRIGEILKSEPNGTMLRVSVEGGGCSGFQYKFDTERTRADDDTVIEKSGATVLIDPVSLNYMAGSEIDFGKNGSKIWVAVLEGAGQWHAVDITAADAGKVLPLAWKMPFPAQWRVDFTRQDGLTDSWDMLLPDRDRHGFIKPSWLAQDGKISDASRTATGEIDRDAYKPGGVASDRLGPDRKRWATVLGWVQYPCWSDPAAKGFLQPLKHRRLTFDGPVLIYAVNRLAETQVTAYTAVDIVRNTLGPLGGSPMKERLPRKEPKCPSSSAQEATSIAAPAVRWSSRNARATSNPYMTPRAPSSQPAWF